VAAEPGAAVFEQADPTHYGCPTGVTRKQLAAREPHGEWESSSLRAEKAAVYTGRRRCVDSPGAERRRRVDDAALTRFTVRSEPTGV
jgi:hypothetical protein